MHAEYIFRVCIVRHSISSQIFPFHWTIDVIPFNVFIIYDNALGNEGQAAFTRDKKTLKKHKLSVVALL